MRIQAVGGKMEAACMRLPARLVGNGQQTAAELLAREQATIKTQNPANSLVVDAQVEALLTQQRIFALDVITADPTQAPTPSTAWALEINGESYWLHHTFSEIRTHNMARLILKDTFDLT
ncbi:MAG: hypothetical protein ACRBFS_10025 [Aureispira sp.]